MNSVKGFLLCALLLCGVVVLGAQTPEWEWAVSAGGTGIDYGVSIAIDSQGNKYMIGFFNGIANFGAFTLSSSGDSDIFAAKLDPAGNWLWAVKAGGPGCDEGNCITVDNAGNAYLTGSFSGTSIFGTHTLTSSGYDDIFAAKLDPTGNWLWAVKAGGSIYEIAYGISVDSANNAYLTGIFLGTATFGTHTLTSFGGYYDIFAAKLDPTGNWLWAVKAGGSSHDSGVKIALDSAGDAWLTGSFRGTATFGPFTLTSSGSYDIFAAKLDPAGNWLWAVKAGGTLSDYGRGIDIDDGGNAYLTGSFSGTATFGSHTLTSSGESDIFAAKLDPAGNWLWAVKAGGSSSDDGHGITVDNAGNTYLTGYFSDSDYGYGTATFGTHTLTSFGGYDIFAAKLDPAGNWLWAVKAGGTSWDYGSDIALDSASNAWLTGSFSGTATFGTLTLTSSGDVDIFAAKLPALNLFADFSAGMLSGPYHLSVQFIDQSTAGQYPIISWLWSFGDGESSTQQNPVHTFTTPGIYTVSLTVMDQSYQTSTLVRPAYITVIERVYSLELTSNETLNFGNVYLGQQSEYQAVSFTNTGNVDLNLSDIHFLSEPLHFEFLGPFRDLILPPGEADSILVRFAPQTIGALSDTLFIVNDSSNNPVLKVRLNGTGLYVPPQAPANVVVVMDGNNALISWDAVTQDIFGAPITPDFYYIFNSQDPYGSFTFRDATAGLQYTHPMISYFQPRMFYKIIAYKNYGRGGSDISSMGLVPGMSEEDVSMILHCFNKGEFHE